MDGCVVVVDGRRWLSSTKGLRRSRQVATGGKEQQVAGSSRSRKDRVGGKLQTKGEEGEGGTGWMAGKEPGRP